jgi:hypothetical protein
MSNTWPWNTDGLTLANLKDVDLTGLQEGQTLVSSGTTFIPGTPSGVGTPGVDGRDIELQRGTTYIQWRYVGDLVWIDLVPLVELHGTNGTNGLNGTDGVTPIKGVDYNDGAPGTPGVNGVTPTKGVDYFDGAKGDKGDPGTSADPWIFVKLADDFTTSLATNTNVTNFKFTPAANKTYLVFGTLMLRTATATIGARPGIAWPTGLTDATARIEAANSLTVSALQLFGALTTKNAASTGLATTTHSHYGGLEALIIVGASPSGDFQITLASETAGTNVTIKAGSFFMYREI